LEIVKLWIFIKINQLVIKLMMEGVFFN